MVFVPELSSNNAGQYKVGTLPLDQQVMEAVDHLFGLVRGAPDNTCDCRTAYKPWMSPYIFASAIKAAQELELLDTEVGNFTDQDGTITYTVNLILGEVGDYILKATESPAPKP
jgi:hypothetical protein